jgi:hypothetical protein
LVFSFIFRRALLVPILLDFPPDKIIAAALMYLAPT